MQMLRCEKGFYIIRNARPTRNATLATRKTHLGNRGSLWRVSLSIISQLNIESIRTILQINLGTKTEFILYLRLEINKHVKKNISLQNKCVS